MNEKLKVWFKDWHNRIFILVFLLALGIRLYYLHVNSAVWWDEADYLSSAKHWFFNVPYNYNPQRGILFPLLIGILFKLGFSETLTRIFVVLLPSLGVVVLTYLLGKQMYNKNVGLIASSIMSVFWVSLFWTNRFSNDFLAFFFQLLALYCFWMGVVKNHSKYFTWLFGLFLGLGFITRAQSILIGGSLFLFLVIVQRFKFLANKDLWISVLFFLIPVLPYLGWLWINFKTPLAFSTGYSSQVASNAPFAWAILQFIYQFSAKYLFILFLIGLASLADLLFGLDLIFKRKAEEKVQADIFWLIASLVTLAFFIFWLRGAEDRWVILLSIPIFLFVGKGCMLIYEAIKKKNIHVAALLVMILVIAGMYIQFSVAQEIIGQKKDTYKEVKDAALWMKEHTTVSDKLYSASGPQTTYYSERDVLGFPGTEAEFLRDIKEKKPKFMTISVFERHPDWVANFPNNHPALVIPVNAWFADSAKTQPLLIIFAFKAYE